MRKYEQAQDAQRLLVQRLHALQKRRLFIEHLARIGVERGRDVQRALLDERIRSRVPCGVAARLEGRAHAAAGEAGSVRLADDQLFARKLHDDLAVLRGRDETVVFFGGDARHRLEPMGVMRRAFRDRPLLHRVRHGACDAAVERLSLVDGLFQRFEHVLGELFAHHVKVEHVLAEHFGYCHCGFSFCPAGLSHCTVTKKAPRRGNAFLPFRGHSAFAVSSRFIIFPRPGIVKQNSQIRSIIKIYGQYKRGEKKNASAPNFFCESIDNAPRKSV